MGDVLMEGRKMQQHRLEALVKNHLGQALDLPADYFKTELEKTMHSIMVQFIESVKDESKKLDGFSSIYL